MSPVALERAPRTRTAAAPLEAVIGPLGVVARCEPVLTRPNDPRIFLAAPKAASTRHYRPDAEPAAGGAGFTPEAARASAIGECVERYAAGSYQLHELVRATADELGDAAVGFDAFAYYTEAQTGHPHFPFARYRRDRPLYWCRGRALADGAPRYVPACLVYLTYRGEGDDLFTLAVSTGTACHGDPARAALYGLYEVVERDAFMMSWLRAFPLPRLRLESAPALAALHRRHFARPDLACHVFDITTDIGLPSVLCLLEGRSPRGPIFAVGAATRASEGEAIAKAMLEAGSDLMYARALLRRKPGWRPDPDYGNVREFEDHVRLYCEPEMARHLDFLLGSPRVRDVDEGEARPPADVATSLAGALARVRAVGLEPVVVDITPDDVAAAGLHCVKVLVPGAVPLTSVHGMTPIGSPRLRQAPRPAALNRIPHPFP